MKISSGRVIERKVFTKPFLARKFCFRCFVVNGCVIYCFTKSRCASRVVISRSLANENLWLGSRSIEHQTTGCLFEKFLAMRMFSQSKALQSSRDVGFGHDFRMIIRSFYVNHRDSSGILLHDKARSAGAGVCNETMTASQNFKPCHQHLSSISHWMLQVISVPRRRKNKMKRITTYKSSHSA